MLPHRHLSHDPYPEVLSARNAQLRVRLAELDLLYTCIVGINDGAKLTNFAGGTNPSLVGKLDLSPSKVTWAGHSFGSATMVQFLKSVFWHQRVPTVEKDKNSQNAVKHETLYTPAENSLLQQQVTPSSPLVLLDLWTMPLRGDATLWLWEKPLPCFSATNSPDGTGTNTKSNTTVLAIMSQDFYNITSIIDRTKAALSRDPATAGSPDGTDSSSGPRLFYASKTAHLSQSDLALLFPWAAKTLLKVEDEPERTLQLNIRAILQLLRVNGIPVRSVRGNDTWGDGKKGDNSSFSRKATNDGDDDDDHDDNEDDPAILATTQNGDGSGVRGWIPLSIGG
jgi:platelet-activating factor acetylhydrolase